MKLEFRTAGETLPPLPPTQTHTHTEKGRNSSAPRSADDQYTKGTETHELLGKLIGARLLLRLEYRERREGTINASNNTVTINTSVEKSCHGLIDVVYQK